MTITHSKDIDISRSFDECTEHERVELITNALRPIKSYIMEDCFEKKWYAVHVVCRQMVSYRSFRHHWIANLWLSIHEFNQRRLWWRNKKK